MVSRSGNSHRPLQPILLAVLACSFASPAKGQIPQDQPQLCGGAGSTTALPEGTTAVTTVGGADLTIKLLNGASKTLELDGPDNIEEVCPLGSDRLLVFGPIGGGDGYIVWIISQFDGRVLDRLGARDPSVSPNQHWLVYRQRYPPVVQVVFEQYLLYDITKGAVANHVEGITPQRPHPPGKLIYPVTEGRARLDDFDLPLDQHHEFASTGFFWSPDSTFVAFGDRAGNAISIVIVRVASGEPKAYAFPVNLTSLCNSNRITNDVVSSLLVSRVEFSNVTGEVPGLRADFTSSNPLAPRGADLCARTLQVHPTDLKPAEVEVHKR